MADVVERSQRPGMSESEWLAAFAAALGVGVPTAAQREDLLALAGTAAHAAERAAAPLSCWLAAVAGVEPARALELARALAAGEGAGTDPAPSPGA